MKLSAHIERWPARRPFRITGLEWNHFESIVVEIEQGGYVGRGEALGVYYRGESAESMLSQAEDMAHKIAEGLDQSQLHWTLPAGGARNAIDCALWDLNAKRHRTSIWQLAGVTPKPLQTVYTIGLESTPSEMAHHARSARALPLLKVKLDGNQPVERIQAIRAVRPDARLVVDANQGWSFRQLVDVAPVLAALGVEMIEQPLPRGGDSELDGYSSPVPLCADESCLNLEELDAAEKRYQRINIKLDKTGGLTHALALAREARLRGLGLMVGCMGGSSLAMAPAFVVGCLCDLVDIDGPLLLKTDRLPGLDYVEGRVEVFGPDIWG